MFWYMFRLFCGCFSSEKFGALFFELFDGNVSGEPLEKRALHVLLKDWHIKDKQCNKK